jgi:hypothetical protein
MLETSPLVLDLYYDLDDGTSVASGVATTAIKAFPQSNQKAMVIEIVDGDVTTRYAIPIVEIGEREEVNHNLSEGTMWGVTADVMGSDLEDMGYRITDDPTFVALGS